MQLKIIKYLYVLISLQPILFIISLYTLYYRLKTPGVDSAILPDNASDILTFHYNFTDMLLKINLLTIIPDLFITVALIIYCFIRKINLTPLFVFYFIGIVVFICILRIDPLNAVSWFHD
jgi:hypothetical protein